MRQRPCGAPLYSDDAEVKIERLKVRVFFVGVADGFVRVAEVADGHVRVAAGRRWVCEDG